MKKLVNISQLPKATAFPGVVPQVVEPQPGKRPAPSGQAPAAPPRVVNRVDQGLAPHHGAATPTTGAAPTLAPASGELAEINGFDGAGPDCCTPPDTQVAVGPYDVVEMVNTTGHVYTRAGTETSSFNLGGPSGFFGAPHIAMTSPTYSDPRVVYDALSGHFFASILIVDNCGRGCPTLNNSEVDIAASAGTSPTDWIVFPVETNTSNVLFDQPKLGVSNDKVVMTYNENGFGGPYRFVVLQKSDLTARRGVTNILREVFFGLDSSHFNMIPVMSMSGTSTEYAVNADWNSTTLTLGAFTGTPVAGPVALTLTDFGIGRYTTPPGAVQPNDTRTLDTGPPGVQSAVWDNGVLWAAGNDSCVPAGDTRARACLRLDRLTTSGTSGSLTQDIDVGQNGAYLFYPAVMTDAAGNLFIGHSLSSSSQYGTAAMTYFPAGLIGGGQMNGVEYQIGAGKYDCTFCYDTSTTPPTPTENRWGDYSGAARDPANPNNVWLAEEWGSTSSTNTDAWGTEIGQFTAASGWQNWESLGGVATSGPTVSSWAPGRLDLFVRGQDNAIWYKSYSALGWSNWASLGGAWTSAPAAVSWANGRTDVFVRGSDNALWHKYYDNGWSNWEWLGGTLTAAPAVSSWAAGRLDVFARGTDNAMWHKSFSGGSWSAWESLGGTLTSAPAAVSWGNGRIDTVARLTDNALWHKYYDNGSWSNWESLSGTLASDPAISSWAPGRLDVFALGNDTAIWHKSYDGGWTDWASLGGSLATKPAAVSWTIGRIDLFATGNDAAVWHKSWD